MSELSPKGDVSIDGVIWDARLKDPNSSSISRGSKVMITGRSGLTLEVQPEPIKQKVAVQEEGSS